MRKILIVLILISLCLTGNAQIKSYKAKSPYPYLVYTPDVAPDSNGKYPLIVFLHGRSLSGKNFKKLYRYGPIAEIQRGLKVPFLVVAPQTTNSWNPGKLNQMLDQVIEDYPVDTSRIYVWGMSMGGYGTFYFAGKFAERFAAAIAMCGGGDTTDAPNMIDLPLWVIHGTKDHIIPISESEKMVEAIQCAGGDKVIFTRVEGWNHGSPARCFREMEKYNWLLEHRKASF